MKYMYSGKDVYFMDFVITHFITKSDNFIKVKESIDEQEVLRQFLLFTR